jgi:hypothetical protein
MYQVGQAVIITFNLETQMVFVYQETIGEYIRTSGLINPNDSATVLTVSTRSATEAEILAEAVNHGWKYHNVINIDSPTKDVYLQRTYSNEPWKIGHVSFVNDYSIFGQECITAHRLITALNLAK